MPSLYLNTYRPLVFNAYGCRASERFNLKPFIDGSVRREPDLEHAMPSISCLCRGRMFAPRLKVGDIVVYLTVKARYGDGPAHRRLSAVLEVGATFNGHVDAAGWYRKRGLPVPNNCMVRGNPPCPLEHSHHHYRDPRLTGRALLREWDDLYKARAVAHGRFVVCRPLWVQLGWDAPALDDEDLILVFGRVPPTRTPGRLRLERLSGLLRRAGIRSSDLAPAPTGWPPTQVAEERAITSKRRHHRVTARPRRSHRC